MFLNSIAATNVGKIRENNEDNFFLCGKYKKSPEVENMIVSDCRPHRRYLFGVCDGMGGADYGEIAALIAVETMSEYWENASSDICGCAQDANLKICSAIESNESKRMGATFAAALVEDNIAHIYNVGDSRVYLIHNNSITQLSEDHTYAQMLVNQGIITQEQAKMHNGRNVLTQHLGIFPDEMLIEAFCAEPIKLDLSDTLLLCSDGLTDMLSDKEILDVCCSNDEPSAKGNKLIGFALKNGGRDNITVVLAQVEE